MGVFICFAIAGISLVVLILKFDKKQTVKMKSVLKESRSIPPMFLLKATEQKIAVLKSLLRYDDAPLNIAVSNLSEKNSEGLRMSKVQELKILSARYNNGLISINTYNARLDELLEIAHQHSHEFVMAS